MSQRPRRTAELVESTSKPSRVSRLRQPSNAKRSLDRASSCEQLSSSSKNYLSLPNSYNEGGKRSISATPQRTPNRSIPYSTTTNQLLTTEKERPPAYDKKLLQIEANRITDFLRCIESSLGSNFFERGGIKTMSTKQFIIIMNFFFKKILGNRLTIGTQHVDSIANILTEIEYPYSINKSWLKTPTALHAFHNVVTLFNWLIQFVNPTMLSLSGLDEYENLYVMSNDKFPDSEYICKFIRRTKNMFSLWNNGTDGEYLDKIKEELSNEYILKRVGLHNYTELKENISDLKFMYNELQNKERVHDCKDEYHKLDLEIKSKMKMISKLEASISDTTVILKQIKSLVDDQTKVLNDGELRVFEIQQILDKQSIDIQQRDQFIEELSTLNQEIQANAQYISALQDMNYKDQILLSRLVHQKSELITAINIYMYKILMILNEPQNYDIEEYKLNKDYQEKDICKIITFLEKIKDANSKNMEIYTKELHNLEKQLPIIEYQHQLLTENLNESEVNLLAIKEKLSENKIENIKQKSEADKELEDLKIVVKNLIMSIEQTNINIVAKSNDLEKATLETEAIALKFQTKTEQIIEFREKRLQALEPLVKSLNQALDNTFENLKDIL